MKKLLKKLATIAAAIVAAFGAFSFNTLAAHAEDSATKTTSVMEDLQADATFSKDAYPSKTVDELKAAGEELLQVIRIGESVNAELYIYVYQPSDATKEIVASKILIGQTASENAARVYPLKLVSTEGVFDKYLVDGLTVLEFPVRHYQITSIYRPFDAALDAETGNDNVNTNMAVPVAQTWYARNSADGKIEYAHTTDKVITITDEWHGSIRYYDGADFTAPPFQWKNYTDSHFVAFTTDREIQSLKSAEIFYTSQYVEYQKNLVGNKYFYNYWVQKTPVPNHIKITEKDVGSNDASQDSFLLGTHKYEWNRIQLITDFLALEEGSLSDYAKGELQKVYDNSSGNGAFVLRFIETDFREETSGPSYGVDLGAMSWECSETRITDVAILKLTFVTDGISYTLGVVDSMTSSDNIPDGEYTKNDNMFASFKKGIKDIQKGLRLISLVSGCILLIGILAFGIYGITKPISLARMNKFFKNNGGGSGKPPIDKGGGSG